MFSPQDDYSADDLGDEIVGLPLKCGKGGIYTLDEVPIRTGPDGFEFYGLPEHGQVGLYQVEGPLPRQQAALQLVRPPSEL